MNSTYKLVYPDQVDFSKFLQGAIVNHNTTDFSIPLLYNSSFLVLQLNAVPLLFDLQSYQNPHQHKKKDHRYNYSLCIALKGELDESNPIDPLNRFLLNMDILLMNFLTNQVKLDLTQYSYESPIRKPRDKVGSNHLRIKLPSNLKELKVDLYENDIFQGRIPIERAKKEFLKDVRLDLQIEFKPIWFSKTKEGVYKYGYSYRCRAIGLTRNKFLPKPENLL